MIIGKSLLGAGAILAFVSGAMPAAAEMASPSVLANTCFSCHGANGRSEGAMPSINGKSAKYIEVTLKAFRDGKKQSTVMQRIAKGFDDAEIKAMAAYLAKQSN